MAKRKVNKTAAVKEYLEANPNAGPKEVAAALKQEKISITPAHVSNIKSKIGQKGVGKRRRKATAAKMSGGGPLSSKLAEAIELVEKVGGIDKAKETLDAVQTLERT